MRAWFFDRVGAGLSLLLLSALGGCSTSTTKPAEAPSAPNPVTVPAHVVGTVREFAVYDTTGSMPVQGYGLVEGLGKNGAGQVPEHVRDYMVTYLSARGIGDRTKGLGHVQPMDILKDVDTAVVLVAGLVPFGAPLGARFDINLAALPDTQTRSLHGGNLMTTDLALYFGAVTPGGSTRPLARGGGPVFVNPFVDPNDSRELVKWREGRVLGGGRVVIALPVLLRLRQPDFQRAHTIADRINGTFSGTSGNTKVANARDRGTIEVTVPPSWAGDYEHFLELVMHVPLSSGAMWEGRARELVRLMEAPEAVNDDISLILESMGRNIVPLLKPLYASRNASAAFYAARAGGRLGDEGAEEVLIRLANETHSPFQIPAINELGRDDRMVSAMDTLRKLIDDENNEVCIAAYEALARRHDDAMITHFHVPGQLDLDMVKSRRSYVIYASQTMRARLAVFGADMPVAKPVYFSPPDEMVTIRSLEGDSNLAVFRRLPNGRYSDVLACAPTVQSLVLQLASIPDVQADGTVYGLRLTYAELLSVLHRMCLKGDIPAKFTLQSDTPASRIRTQGPAVGRPDVPGS
jgi:hypothetical protein